MVRDVIEFLSANVTVRLFGLGKSIVIECFLYRLFGTLLTKEELNLCIQNYEQAIDVIAHAPTLGNEANRKPVVELWAMQLEVFKQELARRS